MKNPTCYLIPHEFQNELRNIKAEIEGLAKKNRTSRTNIGDLLTDWALQKVRVGELVFEYRPEMMIVMVDASEDEKDREVKPLVLEPVEKVKVKHPKLNLGYRFTGTQQADIRSIANQCNLPQGEVMIRLLQYALEKHQAGAFSFVPRRQSFAEIKEK